MNSEMKEAKQHFKSNPNYFECPHSCGAVYEKSALTHRNFCCKDCNNEFRVPAEVKIKEFKPFKRKEVRNG